MTELKSILQDIFVFPSLGLGSQFIWVRNFYNWRRAYLGTFFWLMVEPLIYLLGIGYGVGSLIDGVNGQAYVVYLAPALMVISAVINSYYESTYGIFNRLENRGTYSSMLISPVSPEEISFGEVLWGAAKGFASTIILMAICFVFGIFTDAKIVLCLPIFFMVACAVSAFGVIIVSNSVKTGAFILVQSGIIVPMCLFSDTYFPLAEIPQFAQQLVYLSPITHAMLPVRMILEGNIQSSFYLHIGFLFLLTVILVNMASVQFGRRLLKK